MAVVEKHAHAYGIVVGCNLKLSASVSPRNLRSRHSYPTFPQVVLVFALGERIHNSQLVGFPPLFDSDASRAESVGPVVRPMGRSQGDYERTPPKTGPSREKSNKKFLLVRGSVYEIQWKKVVTAEKRPQK